MRNFLLVLLPALTAAAADSDWPQFRGPSGQGHAPEGAAVPLTWSETENIRWRVPVPGRGWSSPVIAGDTIWLTTAIPIPFTDRGQTLRLFAFDKETGAMRKDLEIFQFDDIGEQHAKNSFASPTPVVDGDMVYVHFGKLGTAAVSTEGELIWKTSFPHEYVHGTGNSPVIHGDLLIVNCDGADKQFVVALDKRTGEVKWNQQRPKAHMAYATPLVIEHDGKPQVVSPGAHRAISYDPATGEALWSVEYGSGFSNVPRPLFAHGLVYICTGFYKPEVLAIRPDGKGDVTASHVVWRAGRGVPLTPSPIVVGDEIYFVSDNGILSCLDAKTGESRWQERLGGNFSASPLYAAGRLYWFSEEGEVTVIEPGREFRKLSQTRFDAPTFASPAVSGKALFVRTATHLYRIEEPDAR